MNRALSEARELMVVFLNAGDLSMIGMYWQEWRQPMPMQVLQGIVYGQTDMSMMMAGIWHQRHFEAPENLALSDFSEVWSYVIRRFFVCGVLQCLLICVIVIWLTTTGVYIVCNIRGIMLLDRPALVAISAKDYRRATGVHRCVKRFSDHWHAIMAFFSYPYLRSSKLLFGVAS